MIEPISTIHLSKVSCAGSFARISNADVVSADSGIEIVSKLNEVINHINNSKVDTRQWIPCSERLPDIEADVMLSLRSLDVYTGFMANTEGCFYVEGEGYVEAENVLAWMPLPAPYKEEGEFNE